MNVFSKLNEVIDYIEHHLDEDIDIGLLAKMVGINEDTFKRFFNLICDFSITDYIKQRRLTVATEDLKTDTVLNVAVKYGYSSSESFSRAFYKFHGILPKDIKNSKNLKLNAVLPLNFDDFKTDNFNLEYKIQNFANLSLYGNFILCNIDEISTKVNNEWKKFKEKYPNQKFYYGVLDYIDDKMVKYWFCIEKQLDDLKLVNLLQTNFLVFVLNSHDAHTISKFSDNIYKRIAKNLNKNLSKKMDLEIYNKDKTLLCYNII